MGAGAPSSPNPDTILYADQNVAGSTLTVADDTIHAPKYISKDHTESKADIYAVPKMKFSALDSRRMLI
ncbi:hypothetical protein VMCG_10621 [Cytospora schulzeri]|uniref:Uncharacterized protein n=1 Tax=Cytospora schulzeri TaxID=448051 RepID=A0A423V9V2_9PEZI|nr:hypothetical protein VMCG_10621 [Valsa malicola]